MLGFNELIECNLSGFVTNSTQFNYFNEVGSRVDRFSIDLYDANGDGDCGTYVTTICDKPSVGCKDSSEFIVHK